MKPVICRKVILRLEAALSIKQESQQLGRETGTLYGTPIRAEDSKYGEDVVVLTSARSDYVLEDVDAASALGEEYCEMLEMNSYPKAVVGTFFVETATGNALTYPNVSKYFQLLEATDLTGPIFLVFNEQFTSPELVFRAYRMKETNMESWSTIHEHLKEAKQDITSVLEPLEVVLESDPLTQHLMNKLVVDEPAPEKPIVDDISKKVSELIHLTDAADFTVKRMAWLNYQDKKAEGTLPQHAGLMAPTAAGMTAGALIEQIEETKETIHNRIRSLKAE